MNRLWLIAGLCTFASIGVSACSEAPRATQADDISPIDGQKLRAFNTWLDEQKTDEDDKGFEAKPMRVSGIGRVRAKPDIAVISAVIEAEADRDDIAMDDIAKIINAVQTSLEAQDVELNFTQVQTSEKRDDDCLARNQKALANHYSIQSDNQYNNNIKRRLEQGLDIKIKPRSPKPRQSSELCPVTHMESNLAFTVRVKPANEAGNVINDLTTAGVSNVDLLGYDFSDYDTLYKEASAKAVRDAKLKAERIAAIAGTNLTEITGFYVDRPGRITRLGRQAMIITNHQNQNYGSSVRGRSSPGYSDSYNDVLAAPVIAPPPPPPPPPPPQFQTGWDGSTTQAAPVVVQQIGEIQASVELPPEASGSYQLPSNANSTNALKMSLQAGQTTITVNAYLDYLYETPIDGTIVPEEVN